MILKVLITEIVSAHELIDQTIKIQLSIKKTKNDCTLPIIKKCVK